jgi:uncharacterized integral membrane protein (TIGR00698 family)
MTAPFRRKSAVFFLIGAALSFSMVLSPPLALAMGILVALTSGHPFGDRTPGWTRLLLQISVVGLGFGMNLQTVYRAGLQGFWLTLATIGGTLILGTLLGRALRVEGTTATLISSGTAICGGSAIAAVGSALGASSQAMSVSLGTVFVLNSVALIIFPPLGHALGLTQEQFGLWAAIAIHDTSSVVGAAAKYGEEALQIATTVKLLRALWIVPLALFFAWRARRVAGKISYPWFILFFLLAALLRTLLPTAEPLFHGLTILAKAGLTLTLFLIGASLSLPTIKAVGFRPMILGVILWIIISLVGLLAIGMAAPSSRSAGVTAGSVPHIHIFYCKLL